MDLASKVFDIITDPNNLNMDCQKTIREIINCQKIDYWKQVVRIGALCHDLGHFPFSHAGEELLPDGKTHESLTLKIITNSSLTDIIKNKLKLVPEDVAKVALKPKDYIKEKKEEKPSYTSFEALMSEIITGDSFGVDRMDYLLRDSYHAGVAYGKFDQYRLIETIRILPKFDDINAEPTLGIEEGGIHSAEAFNLARYYMFSQLYLHPVRRAYDLHLIDFLHEWLPNNKFDIDDLTNHLNLTDNEVISSMLKASKDPSAKGIIML
jgi:HD superfamily phosphohydrolase